MSLMDSIETTLKNDLNIVESDARQIASAMATAGKQSFTAILETVLPKAKETPIGEILSGVFQIYKHIHAEETAATPTAATTAETPPVST